MKERIILKISPVGCNLVDLPKVLKAITSVYPKAFVRQEGDIWVIFEEVV